MTINIVTAKFDIFIHKSQYMTKRQNRNNMKQTYSTYCTYMFTSLPAIQVSFLLSVYWFIQSHINGDADFTHSCNHQIQFIVLLLKQGTFQRAYKIGRLGTQEDFCEISSIHKSHENPPAVQRTTLLQLNQIIIRQSS